MATLVVEARKEIVVVFEVIAATEVIVVVSTDLMTGAEEEIDRIIQNGD